MYDATWKLPGVQYQHEMRSCVIPS